MTAKRPTGVGRARTADRNSHPADDLAAATHDEAPLGEVDRDPHARPARADGALLRVDPAEVSVGDVRRDDTEPAAALRGDGERGRGAELRLPAEPRHDRPARTRSNDDRRAGGRSQDDGAGVGSGHGGDCACIGLAKRRADDGLGRDNGLRNRRGRRRDLGRAVLSRSRPCKEREHGADRRQNGDEDDDVRGEIETPHRYAHREVNRDARSLERGMPRNDH